MSLEGATPRRSVIVVGVDFSPSADRAIQAAFLLAAQSPGTDVHLVHVAASRTESLVDFASRPDLLRLHEQLQGIAGRQFVLRREGKTRIFAHLVEGNPAREIVQFAVDVHAGLIVIGTNGESAPAKLELGSVALRVLRIASCSVLAIRPNGMAVSPEVELPCAACQDMQKVTQCAKLWCTRHETKHTLSRTYFVDSPQLSVSATAFRHN